jgi:hypothetical protein
VTGGLATRRIVGVAVLRLAPTAATVGFALGVGVLAALGRPASLIAAGAAGAIAVLAAAPLFGRATAVFVLTGALVLLYGFANVGIRAGDVAIPLTEVLLVAAFPWALRGLRGPAGRRAVGWWAAFLGLGLVHVALAFPTYGVLAVRDFLIALEASFLIVGYRLGDKGWPSVVGWLRWVYLACVLYFAAYPLREWLAAVSPVVGIQRDVPLLGQYAGAGPAAIAGFFFMALLRPFGWWSLAVAGLFLAELAMFQGRGDYLAFLTAAGLLLALAGRGGRRGRVRLALAGALLAASFVGALVLPVAPAGRLGPISPEFYAEHVATLVGREGPGAGTIRDRLEWARYTVGLVIGDPYRLLTGVGYGPSLTGGFRGPGGVEVRQPHNDYLETFARLGIPGLVCFVGLLAAVFLPVLRAARRAPADDARFLWWIVTAMVPYLIIAAAQPLLAFPYGTVPLFTLGGIGLAVVDRSAATRVTESPYSDRHTKRMRG